MDARTDVYGLGATLYELLTLWPAVAGADRAELLRRVEWEEPVPPRRINPAVPADLETVVLKALAKEPAERYATAQEFADDLGRFLSDQPIRARRPTLAQRAGRWARRHRPAVAAAALTLVAAVLALAVCLAVIWRQSAYTQAAYEAEAQARAAEGEERRRAEGNLRLALEALDQLYLRLVARQLVRDPQREREDQRLLHKVLDFYEQFAQTNSTDPAVRQEIGNAYRRVGEIQQMLGHSAKADAAYGQAITRLEQLAAEFPDQPGGRSDLAMAWHHRGVLHEHGRRFAEAEHAHRQALDLRQKLAAAFPTASEHRQDVATSLSQLAIVLARTGRSRDAEAAWRTALDQRAQLAAEFPAEGKYRQEVASAQHNLAVLVQQLGRSREAEALYREAVTLLEKLIAEAPVADYRNKLATTCHNLGGLLANTRPDEAERVLRQALALYEPLVSEFPTVPDYRHNLANNWSHLGMVLDLTGQPGEAESAYGRALALLEKLAAEFPDQPRFREAQARTHLNLGVFQHDAGRLPEAETTFRRALALRQQLVHDFPTAPEYRQQLAYGSHNLGNVLRHSGRAAEAAAAFHEAIRLLEPLAAEFPAPPDTRYRLATTYRFLGSLVWAADPPAEAEAAYRRALALLEKLAADFPKSARYAEELAWLLAACPLPRLRDPARAVEWARRAVKLTPRSAVGWTTLGVAHGRAGDWKAAADVLEKALPLHKGGDSTTGFFLALAHAHRGDKEQARQWYDRAVPWMAKHRFPDEELRQLQAEAAALLGLPAPGREQKR